jgi:hypothetical protein
MKKTRFTEEQMLSARPISGPCQKWPRKAIAQIVTYRAVRLMPVIVTPVL